MRQLPLDAHFISKAGCSVPAPCRGVLTIASEVSFEHFLPIHFCSKVPRQWLIHDKNEHKRRVILLTRNTPPGRNILALEPLELLYLREKDFFRLVYCSEVHAK